MRATAGAPTLVKTAAGMALRSGPNQGYLELSSDGIVSPRAGTVEMWVSPVDWNGDDPHFHVFFESRGAGGAFWLYKYFHGGSLMMLTCQDARSGPYNSAAVDVSSWRPGQWHHLAGTWSPTRVRLYVDGKRVAESMPLLPTGIGPTFTIGDQPWHLQRETSSLIRAVRIYDRRLSDAEVAAHALGHYTRTPLTAASFDLSVQPDGNAGTLTAAIEAAVEKPRRSTTARSR